MMLKTSSQKNTMISLHHTSSDVDPEILLYQLEFNKSQLESALQITADYVSKHKLILTGGTAIDLALRSKGESIYDDNALPDYDIISDQNLNHAAALAEILCQEGFKDINVISAVHITTMRVRFKSTALLDATYIPESIIQQIPYLELGDFRVIHPEYQKIDQRLSLSMLMSDTGLSLNIFNRLTKDTIRNALLQEHFDTSDIPHLQNINCKKLFAQPKKISIPMKLLEVDANKLNQIHEACGIYTGDVCISGIAAYALYYKHFVSKHKPLKDTIDPFVELSDKTLSFDLPKNMPISMLHCANRTKETFGLFSKQTPHIYDKLLNLKPITLIGRMNNTSSDIEISDSYGLRIGMQIMDNICVASVDYVLMQFLRDRIFATDDNAKAINHCYYESFLKMVIFMQKDCKDRVWGSSISTYGYDLMPEHKALAWIKLLEEDVNGLKPKNSYLRAPECKTKTEFDVHGSEFFHIDGQRNDQLQHTNLKWVAEKILLKASNI